jgi:glutamine synthetase
MTTAKDVMKLIKDNDVKYADLRFTDPRGKWQHVTVDITTVDEDTFSEGIMFDGSQAGRQSMNPTCNSCPTRRAPALIRSTPKRRWS